MKRCAASTAGCERDDVRAMSMRVHHQCAMTLRHLASRRSLALRCQAEQHLQTQKRLPCHRKLPSHSARRPKQRQCITSSADSSVICRAVKTSEVSAEPEKGSTSSRGDGGKDKRFGVGIRDLNKLADSAPQDVYSSQSSIIRSASQLAYLLDSSLTGGISDSTSQMDDRGSTLGQNSLPERDQVRLPPCESNGDASPLY